MTKRRYELVAGTSAKFWEVELDEQTRELTTRWGRIGSDGRSKTEACESVEAGEAKLEKLAAAKVKKGYQLTGGKKAAPGKKSSQPLLLWEHTTPTSRYRDPETMFGLKIVDYDPEKGLQDPASTACRVRVVHTDGAWNPGLDTPPMAELLKAFFAEPDVSHCHTFILGIWEDASGGYGTAHVETIVENKDALPHLERLFLGKVEGDELNFSELSTYCKLDPVLKAFPRLEHLRVRGGCEGPMEHDRLISFIEESHNWGPKLDSARLPALEFLELWLGDYHGAGGLEDLTQLTPVLSGKLFPRLRHLGLRNCEQADAIAEAVAGSPVIGTLEELDLSMGILTDDGARALLASPAFKKLKKVDLSDTYLSIQVQAQLKQANGNVVTRGCRQESDPERRYISIGE